ncbi:MAG: PSD1 domain-containing protein [Planctomycetia bacterium]|nr:PSD1 domain-containing protein [Planctomycetia bacterium]
MKPICAAVSSTGAWAVAAVGIVFLAAVPASRAADPTPPAASVTFEQDVLPILRTHCLNCHNGLKPKADLDLRTRDAILKGGKHGPSVVPGKPAESPLWDEIASGNMPRGKAALTDPEKQTIRAWIAGGAAGRPAEVVRLPERSPGQQGRDPVAMAALIDREIDQRLARAKVPASPPADDSAFLRRVYLDIVGRIPTAEQAAAFLDDENPDKRRKLIDDLLASPEYGTHFGTVWHNLIVPLDENKRRIYQPPLMQWLADDCNRNEPWDKTVKGLLTAEGAIAKNPAAVFFTTNPEPNQLTITASRLFHGLKLDCAECHDHPFTRWKQQDFWGMAAFFTQVKANREAVTEAPANRAKELKTPGAAIVIPATAFTGAGSEIRGRFLGGAQPVLEDKGPLRPALAAWITSEQNPFFARATVNRLWSHFFGRGLVHPVDDFHEDNPPSHATLLALLADEFASSGFDRKHLIRCLCLTKVYQRSSRPVAGNEADALLLSRMAVKVMSAEVLFDSLGVALGFENLGTPPKALNSLPVAFQRSLGGNARTQFVNFFKDPNEQAEAMDYGHGILQVLRLVNGPQFNNGGLTVNSLAKVENPSRALEALFLSTLARRPTAAEVQRLSPYLARQKNLRDGYAGVFWILINSSEFLVNH